MKVAILTASDTRTPENDVSGKVLREGLQGAGHEIVATRLVPDDEGPLEAALRDLLAQGVDAVVITGGTGVAARDRTPEVVQRVCERELPGFGELFRMLSFEEIGAAAMASRATAGLAGGQLVFALPGSPAACRLALDRLLVPQLPHLVALARGLSGSHG